MNPVWSIRLGEETRPAVVVADHGTELIQVCAVTTSRDHPFEVPCTVSGRAMVVRPDVLHSIARERVGEGLGFIANAELAKVKAMLLNILGLIEPEA